MAMYTFHFCDPRAVSSSFEACELPQDGDALAKAG